MISNGMNWDFGNSYTFINFIPESVLWETRTKRQVYSILSKFHQTPNTFKQCGHTVATSMHEFWVFFKFLGHFLDVISRKPKCNDRAANPVVHLHNCGREVPMFDARLDLLSIHTITSPPRWLGGNQAGVWGEDGPCAACLQAVEDSHVCIYIGQRQSMSCWIWWARHTQSFFFQYGVVLCPQQRSHEPLRFAEAALCSPRIGRQNW